MQTVAVILVKSARGFEEVLRTRFARLLESKPCSHTCHVSGQGASSTPPCGSLNVSHAAYCFGSFDFLLVARATDVSVIENFVVHCLRGEREAVADTQTVVGLSIAPKSPD
jgi:hypothetical protein